MSTSLIHPQPNLLIIGAQKAATTWLRDALMTHPGVFMAAGEPQYFNRDAESWDEYLGRFSGAQGRSIIGEKTPDYLHMSTSRIRRARRLLGSIKIVAILRRPEDRAWSQARMEASSFNRSKLDPAEYARLARHVISLRNRDRCAYARHLKRWISVFGEESLMVGFYQEVVERPDDLMARLFRWLDLDPAAASPLPPPVWQSPRADLPEEVSRYLSIIHGDERRRLEQMGIPAPECWGVSSDTASRPMPLIRHRAEMVLPNALYRIFDGARGRFAGRYTVVANRCFHRYLMSNRRQKK